MKRRPDSNLTSENWDQEEKEERPGEFQRATKEELEQRKISKARRRINADQTPASTSNVFGGFSGFVGQTIDKTHATGPTISSAFSFLSKINSTEKSDLDSKSKSSDKLDAANGYIGKPNRSSTLGSNSKSDQYMSDYMTNLQTLNKCVLDTISLHLGKTPVCILTPIFEDYESHLKKLKEKFSIIDDSNKIGIDAPEIKNNEINSKSSSIFPKFDLNPKPKSETNFFSFTSTAPLTFTETTKDRSITKNDDTDEKLNGIFSANPPKFIFNAQKPFTFSDATSTPAAKHDNAKDVDEGDEDEPPKVEIIPVEENDSKYSKKCKIFVKRGSGYADKGVAMLHLKPVTNSNNTQLLVRANTSLGNILINTLLSGATPVQKMKKNNILIICIPTPDTVPATPTSVLIRMQNEELADELLEELKNCISATETK